MVESCGENCKLRALLSSGHQFDLELSLPDGRAGAKYFVFKYKYSNTLQLLSVMNDYKCITTRPVEM